MRRHSRWPSSQQYLTSHAKRRLIERFLINSDELLGQFRLGLGLRVGFTANKAVIHRLMWSSSDNTPLVLIQNLLDGAVITVLTVDQYQRDYPGNIGDKQIEKVRSQWLAIRRCESLASKPAIAISGFFKASGQLTAKSRALGRWRGTSAMKSLEELGSDPAFWIWVARQVEAKGLSLDELTAVSAGYTANERVQLDYRCEKRCVE